LSEPLRHLGEDQLLDLAHGALDATREAPLLAHIQACEECESRLRKVAADRERFRVRGEALRRGRPAGPRRFTRPLRLLVPAFAVVLALAFWRTRGGDESPAGFPWLPDASSLLVTRDGNAAGGDERLREGLADYTNRDPAAAIEALGRATASGTFESVRRVYLGSALAQVGRREEAAAILEHTPLEQLPEPWRSEGGWTLAVLWRARGNAAGADSLFTILAEGAGPVAGRAKHALRGKD
jgi:hypothetical protein